MMNVTQIPLTNVIGPAFYDLHWDVIEGKHTYYDLIGGRGSLKSTFAAGEIVLGMMDDPDANAVVYRKVADTIGDSTFAQICWCIDKLGVSDKWHCVKSPYRCVYLPTGQEIIFKGLDKAQKSKSIKVRRGYIKYLWFEELDEYAGEKELRTIRQSVLRGGDKFVVFRSMNPPISRTNWANAFIEKDKLRPDVIVSETNYLQAPADWLGPQFIEDAEWLKKTNPKLYEHEYLGVPIGTGSNVFENVEAKQLTDAEIRYFDKIYMGVDWGYYPDPFRWVKLHYDKTRKTIYIYDEYSTNRTRNEDTARYLVEEKKVTRNDILICDSAEPKSIGDYRAYGLNAREAEKGAGSVKYGVKWLQSQNKIIIDPVRCPKTYKEFNEYEYELTKDGEPTSELPDENNHSIDAVRYALEPVWKRRGQ